MNINSTLSLQDSDLIITIVNNSSFSLIYVSHYFQLQHYFITEGSGLVGVDLENERYREHIKLKSKKVFH